MTKATEHSVRPIRRRGLPAAAGDSGAGVGPGAAALAVRYPERVPELPADLGGPNGLAAAFELLPLPVMATRVDGAGILFANRAAMALFNLAPHELAGLDIPDYYLRPGDRERVISLMRRQGWVDNQEVLLRGPGGRPLWVQISGRLMRRGDELVALVTLQDIDARKAAEERVSQLMEELRAQHGALEDLVDERTRALTEEVAERKRAEEALRAGEQLLRDVLHTSSDWLWETGPDHRFTGFSSRVEEALGTAPGQLIGRTRFALAQDGAEAEKWQRHRAALDRREPFRDFTYQCRLPDGRHRFLRISGVPHFAPDGTFLGYRGTASDLTEAVRQQRELARTSAVLQSTLSHMEQGLAVFDPHLRLAAFNDRFRELFFLPDDWLQIGSTTLGDLIRLSVRRGYYGSAFIEDVVAVRLADVARRTAHRFERLMPDGRWLQVNRNPLPDGGVVVTLTDVTTVKSAEEGERRAREEANQARQQMLEAIEAIADGFVLWDAEDRLVLMNSFYRANYAFAGDIMVPGVSFADVIAKVVENGRVPKGHTPESWMRDRLERHRNPGPSYIVELDDGRVIRITDHRTQDGGLVSLRTDVTQLVAHERALEENRRLLRAVIDAVPAIVNVKDRESRYVLMNRFQGEVYGVDPEQAIGHTSADYVGADYGGGSRAFDQQVIATGQALPFTERPFVDVHGQAHTWFTAKMPLKDEAGTVKNIVTVALDITALKRTERARANLARYFAPNLVDVLAEADEPFGPARSQYVAVLFADIVGFTALCEQLAPKVVFALLREFQRRLAAEVFACSGTLDKYIGDGLMATFGTPNPSRSDPSNALNCARRMQDAIAAWNAERAARREPPIRLAIGLHYGPALIGNIGAERRLEFAVIGDTVNIASRLEYMARELEARIVVSGPTVEAIREAHAATAAAELAGLVARGPQVIRGRAEPVDAWTLA